MRRTIETHSLSLSIPTIRPEFTYHPVCHRLPSIDTDSAPPSQYMEPPKARHSLLTTRVTPMVLQRCAGLDDGTTSS